MFSVISMFTKCILMISGMITRTVMRFTFILGNLDHFHVKWSGRPVMNSTVE